MILGLHEKLTHDQIYQLVRTSERDCEKSGRRLSASDPQDPSSQATNLLVDMAQSTGLKWCGWPRVSKGRRFKMDLMKMVYDTISVPLDASPMEAASCTSWNLLFWASRGSTDHRHHQLRLRMGEEGVWWVQVFHVECHALYRT